MTFDEFLTASEEYYCMNPRQRMGQALFNFLYEKNPDLAEQIRGTQMDPFHEVKPGPKYLATIAFIRAHWGTVK